MYMINEGKFDVLNMWFCDYMVCLFVRYGMEFVGYWVLMDELFLVNILVYVFKYESWEVVKVFWVVFIVDLEW